MCDSAGLCSCPSPHCVLPQVVPFSPSSGLLEWVEQTLPMADYLVGPTRTAGAHMRYRRPGDYTWLDCYQKVGLPGEAAGWQS
jgi:hypothetical protein